MFHGSPSSCPSSTPHPHISSTSYHERTIKTGKKSVLSCSNNIIYLRYVLCRCLRLKVSGVLLSQTPWIESFAERRDVLLCAKNVKYTPDVLRCSLAPFAVSPHLLYPTSTHNQNIPRTTPCPVSLQNTQTRNPFVLPRFPIEYSCKSPCRKLHRSKAHLSDAMLCCAPKTFDKTHYVWRRLHKSALEEGQCFALGSKKE
jgi:hypothetical protein